MKILFISILLLLGAGCATEPLTPEQQYEQEARRNQRHDQLVAFLNACTRHPNGVILETIRVGGSSIRNRKQGEPYTIENVSRNARRNDFQCIDRKTLW